MGYKSSFSRGINSGPLNRYVLELTLCITISLLFVLMSLSKSKTVYNIKYLVVAASKPGLLVANKPFKLVSDFVQYFVGMGNYKTLNESLKKQNDFLKKEFNKVNLLEVENFRLKNLLKLQEVDYVKKLSARIIIDSYRNDNNSIYIDVGENKGLKINDLVFNENGLLGRVSQVGKYSSKILTIYSSDSVLPGISVDTKQSVFAKGDGDKLVLKHLENKFKLKHDELIISTDAAGFFKEGIIIGKIVKTLNDVYIQPIAKKSDSIFVNVLIFDFKKINLD